MNQSFRMKQLLHGETPAPEPSVAAKPVELPSRLDKTLGTVAPKSKHSVRELSVNYVSTDTIHLSAIQDTYGRLSDIVEGFEKSLGVSVVSFEMAHIAPEVKTLQRHDIFLFNGKQFAMSRKPREDTILSYKEKITKCLETGLAFREDLACTVTYNNQKWVSLKLSNTEWTLLLSMFRQYKQSLAVVDDNKLIMSVFAERSV